MLLRDLIVNDKQFPKRVEQFTLGTDTRNCVEERTKQLDSAFVDEISFM